MRFKILYLLALLASAFIIWQQLYLAQFDAYDDNYERIIGSFFMSLIVTFIIILNRKRIIKNELIGITIYYLLVNSPISIFIVFMNYALIFGSNLKV